MLVGFHPEEKCCPDSAWTTNHQQLHPIIYPPRKPAYNASLPIHSTGCRDPADEASIDGLPLKRGNLTDAYPIAPLLIWHLREKGEKE